MNDLDKLSTRTSDEASSFGFLWKHSAEAPHSASEPDQEADKSKNTVGLGPHDEYEEHYDPKEVKGDIPNLTGSLQSLPRDSFGYLSQNLQAFGYLDGVLLCHWSVPLSLP